MGDTIRRHRYQMPMATRNSDIQTLEQCPGKWVLSLIHEKDQTPASYFLLGLQLHESIEVAINLDLDEDWAIRHLTEGLARELERVGDGPVLESSKRGLDTIIEDGQRMLSNWFRFVHPDSPKRAPIYNDYAWPPKTEVEWRNEGVEYPTWGSTDAVFTTHDGKGHAIVDWKSSSTKQRSDDQLHFYRYGLGLPGARAWFHNVDRVQLRSVVQEAEPYPGDNAVLLRIKRAEETKERILERRRVEFNPDWWCNFCPVRQHCPKESDYPDRALANLERAVRYLVPITEIEHREKKEAA